MSANMFAKKLLLAVLCAAMFSPTFALAAEEHGGGIYYAFHLETGVGSSEDRDGVADWDFGGWIGTDENKIKLKSEGERENGVTGHSEFWAMYSRNIDTFWDVQVGVRYDTQPDSLAYGVIGLEGLAPYFFETEVHLFVSEDGDASARIRQENEFFITQRLVTEPYVEANLFAQDVPDLEVGAGLSGAELGLQTHYEFTRGFAPYVDIKYERKFGETSSIAKRKGENNDAVIGSIGVKWMF